MEAATMTNAEIFDSLHTDLEKFLTKEELEMIISHNKMINFAPEEMILQQGKYCSGIYLVIHGKVIITAKILGEGDTELEILEHGNFLGEVSFVERIPCATSVTASSEVKCLLITRLYFEFLAAWHPETKYHLMLAIASQVCNRIKKLHDKIIKFISASGMTTTTLLGGIIQSLAKPVSISYEEADVDIKPLEDMFLFQAFENQELHELFHHAILIKAPKNCTLIRKEEKNASCYIVIHGAVQSSILHEGKTAKLSVIGPARLFSSIACINSDTPFTITFTTCEKSILLKFSEQDLEFFKTNHPEIWYKLFDLICRSFIALEKSVDKLDVRLNVETYNR